jgi:hypothetical protein
MIAADLALAHDRRNFLEVAPSQAGLPGDFQEVARSEAGFARRLPGSCTDLDGHA